MEATSATRNQNRIVELGTQAIQEKNERGRAVNLRFSCGRRGPRGEGSRAGLEVGEMEDGKIHGDGFGLRWFGGLAGGLRGGWVGAVGGVDGVVVSCHHHRAACVAADVYGPRRGGWTRSQIARGGYQEPRKKPPAASAPAPRRPSFRPLSKTVAPPVRRRGVCRPPRRRQFENAEETARRRLAAPLRDPRARSERPFSFRRCLSWTWAKH